MTKTERYRGVVDYFSRTMPSAETELTYKTPFELLVAVMLSAQCTDKRVNMVTPALLARYPDARAMASASSEEILPYIKSVSYPNSKAKHLAEMASMLVEKFHGEVPRTMAELTSLPGVGRKTANVVMSVAFDQQAMAVDTHVFRVSNRIGLTNNSKTPLETEKELVKNFPNHLLSTAHHWLILHGRYICIARKPKCEECGIQSYCKYFQAEQKKNKKEPQMSK
ncbi:endonuclease III [Porphyromonas macacae]|uniref:Endonuclease III n=1 Tax=Porphyromonas macacae TaxID=28115 RepID=A0A0A2EBV5_9PORP|nr:endonuclease III [Porphyromonas macacae]KGN76368.1 endonuclease III [Porphyromonas macacae]